VLSYNVPGQFPTRAKAILPGAKNGILTAVTLPRKHQIDPETTRYYHCMGRCVRRAFLCGIDRATGCDYTHRKQWVLDRLKSLARLFAIDVCAYSCRLTNGFTPLEAMTVDSVILWGENGSKARAWLGACLLLLLLDVTRDVLATAIIPQKPAFPDFTFNNLPRCPTQTCLDA
jgi:hypothetical protein